MVDFPSKLLKPKDCAYKLWKRKDRYQIALTEVTVKIGLPECRNDSKT